MNKNQSKQLGIIFIVIVLAGLGYFGWYINLGPGKDVDKSPTNSTTTGTSNTSSEIVPDVPAGTTTNSDPVADWLSFSKTNINFTFKYPKTWKINAATATALVGNPDIKQKTVKIITDSGVEYHLDNPAVDPNTFADYTLKNQKDVLAGALTFKRSYGLNNANGQTIYVATYTDPNNLDAAGVSFYGASAKLDAATITNLDNLVSSFRFTQ